MTFTLGIQNTTKWDAGADLGEYPTVIYNYARFEFEDKIVHVQGQIPENSKL